MKIKISTLAWVTMMMAACTSGPIKMAQIEETINMYAAAIRFGEYEKAQEFQIPAKRKRLDLDWLKNIHVSSYDIVFRKENLGGNIHELTAHIHYYIETSGVEKMLIDHQVWRYDEALRKLQLETDLPTFR